MIQQVSMDNGVIRSTTPPRQRHAYCNRRAFSLVELSIILVILGLLAGGVLSGQSLIKASELRSVTSDYAKIYSAFYTFREKYFALPGDMPTATTFWGIAAGSTGSDTTCVNTSSTDQKTCNGDGNLQLNGEGTYGSVMRFEVYRAWQHLANAGLIEGQYTGVTGPGNNVRHSVPRVNTPASRLANGGYDVWYNDPITSSSTTLYEGEYGNAIVLGAATPWDISLFPILTPAQAWNLDTKLDDGKPGTGDLRSTKRGLYSNACATTDTGSTALYSLNDTSIQCTMIYIMGF